MGNIDQLVCILGETPLPALLPVVEESDASIKTSSARRPDIQGLRAIAVLMVVAFHAGLPVPGGFVGVDVFFTISGFVITAMLHREWHQTGRIRFGRFYMRRFKRLTPALALMVAVTMLISVLVLSPLGPQQTAAKTAIGAMLLAANFVIARTTGGYFDAPADTNPLLNTWSLSVEEQFYLAFPALLALGWMLAHRRGPLRFSPIVIVAGVAVVSFALALAGSQGITFRGSGTVLGFYSPFTRAWEFAFGALLALYLAKRALYAPRTLSIVGVIGLGMLAASLWLITDATPFPGIWTLLPVTGTLLLILAGDNQGAFSTRALSFMPLTKIGDWSYSIYLWHWPFIVFAVAIWPSNWMVVGVAVTLSLIPALSSYRSLEQPLRMSLKGLTLARWTGLISFTLLVPIGLATAVLFSTDQGWWSSQIRQLQSATLPSHIGALNGCNTREPLGSQQSRVCIWNQDTQGKPIFILGDSNADHFSEGFIAAGKALNRPVLNASTNECPFVSLDFVDLRDEFSNEACRSYVEGTLEYLSGATPGLVVISNANYYWTSPDFAVSISGQKANADSTSKIQELGSGLERTVDALQQSGHKVALILAIPHWVDAGEPLWDPARCSLLTVLLERCVAERALARALQGDLEVRSVMRKVGLDKGVSVYDPAQELCPGGICRTSGPGYIRYRDIGHISVPQAEALAPTIQRLIENSG